MITFREEILNGIESTMQLTATARGLRRLKERELAREIWARPIVARRETAISPDLYRRVTGREISEGITLHIYQFPQFWAGTDDLQLVGRCLTSDQSDEMRLTVKRFQTAILCEAYRLGERPEPRLCRYGFQLAEQICQRDGRGVQFLTRQIFREELVRWNHLLRGAAYNLPFFADVWPSKRKRERYRRAVEVLAEGWYRVARDYAAKSRDVFAIDGDADEIYLHPEKALTNPGMPLTYCHLAEYASRLIKFARQTRPRP